MKAHYFNILLLAFPLNILVYNQRNHKSIPQYIPNNRSLCECDLYMPNYDNDPKMKSVMDNFNKQTQQRFHEYDERMIQKRMQCKYQCDKEIQKIILKDKLEKQMAEQFTTLHTDIQSDAIPTCICEKSIADKMEKGCLRCGGILGAAMPELGVMGATALYALSQWKTGALLAATRAAMHEGVVKGVAAGNALGMKIITAGLEALDLKILGIKNFKSFFIKGYIIDVPKVAKMIADQRQVMCGVQVGKLSGTTCDKIEMKLGSLLRNGRPGPPVEDAVKPKLEGILGKAKLSAGDKAAEEISRTSSNIITEQTALIEGGFNSTTTSIYVSIIAIVVIVLIMVIIYLILRYRRKKKMKKKMQYIKLLE
ncbi:rifin PIR protein,putative [Plasmodium sp. DRC-Itaito]|nr:rifin PIR protein,putative [Plasmodium sp. DRC-Itaito]